MGSARDTLHFDPGSMRKAWLMPDPGVRAKKSDEAKAGQDKAAA